MGKKNFVSYGDSETILTEYASELKKRVKVWDGKKEDWEALPDSEKDKWDYANFTDDTNIGIVTDVCEPDNPNAISSQGTYAATKDKLTVTDIMPTPTSTLKGATRLYIGTGGETVKGGIYECQETDTGVFEWVLISTADMDIDSALSDTSENAVQNKVVKGALDTKQNSTLSEPIGSQTTVEGVLTAQNEAIGEKQPKTLSTPIEGKTDVTEVLQALSEKSVGVDNETIIKDGTTGELSAATATTSTVGVVKPDGSTITVDNDGTIHGTQQLSAGNGITIEDNEVSANTVTFVGTQAEWDSKSTEEKKKYSVADITDDGDGTEEIEDITSQLTFHTENITGGNIYVYKYGKLVQVDVHSIKVAAYGKDIVSGLPKPLKNHGNTFPAQGDGNPQTLGLFMISANGVLESGTQTAGLTPNIVWDATFCYLTED